MRRFLLPLVAMLLAAPLLARTPVPKQPTPKRTPVPTKVLPRTHLRKQLKFAGPPFGTAAALVYSMSADLRIVSDPTAYGATDAAQRTTATQEMQYLGLQHYRTDFTCDNAIWGGGCDVRNLITTYFNTFPADYWIVLPNTSGASNLNTITQFEMPNNTFYGNTIHALEIGNEVNNIGAGFTYNATACGNGNPTWAGCPLWAADYYAQSNITFPGIPLFSFSNPFAMPDNVGLQFTGPFTPSGDPTLADYADVHNYVQGNGFTGPGDFVVTTAFETGSGGADNGMSGNFCGNTVTGNFPAVPIANCPQIPRVTTETGVQLGAPNTSEEARAAMILNSYIIGYIRGWTLVSIYAVADDTTNFGLFQNPSNGVAGTPYQAATAIHNFTTIMNDPVGTAFTPNTNCPSISGNNAPTDYVICGQFYNGLNWLIATGDRPKGEAVETWTTSAPPTAHVWDTFAGTTPIGQSNSLTVDDHPIIMTWMLGGGATPTPTPTVTATATPSPAPTPTPTMSGVPSFTPTPTPTMVFSPTPTGTATPTLTPTATPTAGYQFPSNPTVGQVVTGPGGQKFEWDGVKWIALGGSGGGGGGGIQTINGNNNPAQLIVGSGGIVINSANGTITVDGSGISGGGGGPWLPVDNPAFTGSLTGPTMSVGAGIIQTVTSQDILIQAANTSQANILQVGVNGGAQLLNIIPARVIFPSGSIWFDNTGGALLTNIPGAGIMQFGLSSGVSLQFNSTGLDVQNGPLALNQDATQPMEATTLRQVQALVGGGGGDFLPLAGGSMNVGAAITSPAATTPNNAATSALIWDNYPPSPLANAGSLGLNVGGSPSSGIYQGAYALPANGGLLTPAGSFLSAVTLNSNINFYGIRPGQMPTAPFSLTASNLIGWMNSTQAVFNVPLSPGSGPTPPSGLGTSLGSQGSLWWNTTSNRMEIWTGTAWIFINTSPS